MAGLAGIALLALFPWVSPSQYYVHVGALILLWIKPSGTIVFASTSATSPGQNDRILSFAMPKTEARAEAASKTARKAEETAATQAATNEGKNLP